MFKCHNNIAKHVASIKIMGEIRNKAKTITHINQWTCIRKLSLHKKILCLLRIIKDWFSSYTLYLLNLSSFSSGLNVLEVNIRILTLQDRTKKITIIEKKKSSRPTSELRSCSLSNKKEIPGAQVCTQEKV